MPASQIAKLERPIKVYFSTVVRAAPHRKGGELVLLDWQTKTIEAKVSIYPDQEIQDPNPRGNVRGARGVALLGDNVVVAAYHTLKVYDRKLVHRRDISHSLMAGLHEIYVDDDMRIWVSSTAIDAALAIDFETGDVVQQYWPREMPGLQRELGLTPLEIDKQADNRNRFLERKYFEHPSHLHLNAVVNRWGETYALFHAFDVIANLDRDEVVIRDRALRYAHNLLCLEKGEVIVNDTFGRTVRTYNLHTKTLEHIIRLTNFKLVRTLIFKHQLGYLARGLLKTLVFHRMSAPRPVFVRGVDILGDLLFVGISPASILCIDRRSGMLIDSFRYSDNVAVCVHGLKVLAG